MLERGVFLIHLVPGGKMGTGAADAEPRASHSHRQRSDTRGLGFFWEGAGGHEAAKRVATILSQVFPTFPSVTALDMRAIFPTEVHHDVGKREMKSFPDPTTFVVRVNKGAGWTRL